MLFEQQSVCLPILPLMQKMRYGLTILQNIKDMHLTCPSVLYYGLVKNNNVAECLSKDFGILGLANVTCYI